MFGPDWDAGCPHCSLWADNFNGIIVHLNQRDVTHGRRLARAATRSSPPTRQRMGWSFKWVSSFGSDFNFDYHVSFTPEEMTAKKALLQLRDAGPGRAEREGVSVFYKDPAGACSTPTRPTRAASTC